MNLIDIKNKLVKSLANTQFILIVLICIVFVFTSLFLYRRYVGGSLSKKYVTNNEFKKNGDDDDDNTADIYFFYTEWCPHCKTAKPIWADFKQQMSGQKINGITLNFFEVDCDKDTSTSDKFNVKGFPTIKLMRGNQIIEYDAKPSTANLIEFVNTSLA